MSTPIRSFPHATSHTLLAKFKQQHEDNKYFLGTPVLEPAFIIQHFAGRVKYQIKVGTAQYPHYSLTLCCYVVGTARSGVLGIIPNSSAR